ncbi:BREX system Lon protease-like protein BrxL [Kaistella flava (ex Peng et al. 2021)]|uniref:BREX system Lon protease-like protein BrxL n=1 Tax=Kaistella flava (ex Peng et al. 2021) TaxID=2038776 RepID=A0A7M2Y6J8_9FLAO|nr:BREX system Lon protease-like protein BrxL [Kaistella flava (ex Peng et al. 2021)]QOW09781.1 BREX system Lon protease-like protein BrxL [Kaistella flava (ex Peng et al. 2021)]
MDELDLKLNEFYPGKVVRKDLVHDIKKAANVPAFVLEFLLAKYCATDDPEEIIAGKMAVLEVVEKNYVRPDEANKAQSMVQQKGRHKFIDRIHVKYKEREKRHWAEMENFGSNRIAINEKFYKDNEKLLEGGVWAEVTVGYNEIEDDDYAFYIEDLKPIQLSRFDFNKFLEGRRNFTTEEWINVVLRSVGINPEIIDHLPPEYKGRVPEGKRLKFHFLARLIPLVQANYNFIELGPRGTGKSHFYSEFSPYCTLISGGKASTATLLYNNARKKVGLVGYWDTIGFDEVGNLKITDTDTIQIMKDYMAKGRFSRGREVIANASFAFVGNIDHSIEQVVRSSDHSLFITLPKAFDFAIQDRFFYYLPGWEIPKMDPRWYASNYGLITDYFAEAFHHMLKNSSAYSNILSSKMRLGPNVEGRDDLAIQKTSMALLKIIHPDANPTDEEFDEILEYAIEGRRRVKEQMDKMKDDDEYSRVDLSYFNKDGIEKIIYCPESKAVLQGISLKKGKDNTLQIESVNAELNFDADRTPEVQSENFTKQTETKPKNLKILYGDIGYSYEDVFKSYFIGAESITIQDPYIRLKHQISNFIKLAEMIVKIGDCKKIHLITSRDDRDQREENKIAFEQIADSLYENDIQFTFEFSDTIHGREVKTSNGWRIVMDRGLDYFQSLAGNYLQIGANDQSLRPCLETSFDFIRSDE